MGTLQVLSMEKHIFVDGKVEPGLDQFESGVLEGDVDEQIAAGIDIDLREQINPGLYGSYEIRQIKLETFHRLFERQRNTLNGANGGGRPLLFQRVD